MEEGRIIEALVQLKPGGEVYEMRNSQNCSGAKQGHSDVTD